METHIFCLFVCMFLKLFFLYPKEVKRGKRSIVKRMEREEKIEERRGEKGKESRKGAGKEGRRGHKHSYLAAAPGQINLLLGAAIAQLSAVRSLCFMLQLASL